MSRLFFLKYQLYLLQLENYELGRYFSLLFKKGYFTTNQPLRKNLVLTSKILAISLISIIIFTLILVIFAKVKILYLLLIAVLLIILAPVIFSISLIILLPFEALIRTIIITRAKKLISQNKELKIIGIAGSYGKTTMKNVLNWTLSGKFKVLSTPESVNTPLGIARWLLANLKPDVDILIIEMGEHYKGDIKYLCSITPPNIGVLTGVNESHLERLNSLTETIKAIFELVENQNESLIVLNGDDQNILDHYQKYIDGKKTIFYNTKESHTARFKTEDLSWHFEVEGLGNLVVPVLGQYIIGDVLAAISISKELGMTQEEIRKGISNIKPIEHRLQPIKGQTGVLVIDDSYNGNPDGVQEAIKTLSRFDQSRKVFLTPGLVETGKSSKDVHLKIGRDLATVADLVILIKNSVTPWIKEGLIENNFPPNQILWFNTAPEAHRELSQVLKAGDVILFQNDWGDQYV